MLRFVRAAVIAAALFVSACASSETASISSVTGIEATIVEVLCDNGHGSGVVIDSEGLIVTADHVTSDCPNMRAVFADGTALPATVVASGMPENDVSFIDVVAHDLQYARVSPNLPTRGEAIFTFGWPLQLGRVVTFGHVASDETIGATSADGRRIVLDLSIAPGNSGGGVFNASGELVGIINEIANTRGGLTGFALGLPSRDFIALIPNS